MFSVNLKQEFAKVIIDNEVSYESLVKFYIETKTQKQIDKLPSEIQLNIQNMKRYLLDNYNIE